MYSKGIIPFKRDTLISLALIPLIIQGEIPDCYSLVCTRVSLCSDTDGYRRETPKEKNRKSYKNHFFTHHKNSINQDIYCQQEISCSFSMKIRFTKKESLRTLSFKGFLQNYGFISSWQRFLQNLFL
jgi:hypothetical protein